MRAAYSKLAQQYETQCLPVNGRKDTVTERRATSFLAVDDRLEFTPTQARISDVNFWCIEWIYTLDLDRELFGVDNSIYFQLSKVPHDDSWIKYLGEDKHGRRVFTKRTPKEIIGTVEWKPQVIIQSKIRFKELDVKTVCLESLTPPSSDVPTHREAFLLSVFTAMNTAFKGFLDEHIIQWKADDFCFREVAFALLSLAAGEVTFVNPSSLNRNYKSEGYYLIPDRGPQNEQGLLPRFLYECHAPGVHPGAAPNNTAYWLGNVLVYLTARLDLIEIEETAIAQAVDTGLGQGSSSFYAMVFSVVDVILVHVETNDGSIEIRRSPMLNLFYFDDKNSGFVDGFRSRVAYSPQGVEAGSSKITATSFTAMIRFFEAALDSSITGARSKIFPNEVLGLIMESSDLPTYKALERVSPYCKMIGNHKFRLNDDYALIENPFPNRFILEELDSGMRTVLDMDAGSVDSDSGESSYLELNSGEINNGVRLNLVVGHSVRKAIISHVSLYLPKATPRHPTLYRKGGNADAVSVAFHYMGRLPSHCAEELASMILNMPSDIYPGGIENAWGSYISHLICGAAEPDCLYFPLQIMGAQWLGLLPPGYRQLRMNHLYCNGLHMFLRHPKNECPEEWEKTITHAISYLSHIEQTGDSFRHFVRGRPVIIAFGTKIKFYYYVHWCEGAPLSTTGSAYSVEIAARCVESEPRRRLVQLIPGEGPVDIKEPESREEFENWIKIFRDPSLTEWDPFTESQQPFGEEREY
ncbi:predicted protein [Aspergillus terreus NIH2624]|uniref:Uncharacterized protein n=1 Tax=Aspergillus terreus (strain NIH 2624 / FGSC A1156) TaxID=341663 RepID=Q0CR23_ASPTN|nr:uncharacterized protein ATEG_03861 [Aspergillus terreus NIH2624]EAU35663.1 predicted protein [Aspergillus terreus NIH2624]